ncbi:hypothetical protein Tco_0626592 [Tanacetum coccineum]|uniref:Retroviral polymerase SH3-like domain-containing protein n=1 Tax=Tanacetum coccineum TaxID=301880 RepID=A0ABQ4WK01_9ASTR
MVMALPVQNITIRLSGGYLKEKNFLPLPAAPAVDSEAQVLAQWNEVYDAYNEVACLILRKEGKQVVPYVLKMKGYVEQLERLGYVLQQDVSVGLILNGLTSDFARFVRNYNMHNMGKTVGELHALLIEYEKGKGKGKGKGNDKSYIPKPKNPKQSTKELPAKDDTYRHCKESCEALVKRDTPDKLQQRSVKCIFIGYPKEMMGYYFYFPPENKIVVARYAELLEKNPLSQEISGRAEEIQDEDTSPSENTSNIPMEVEGFEPPQKEVVPIRRSARIHRAPDRLCLNVEVKEHSLGDLNEPTNYKAAILDPESDKWFDAMIVLG